MTALPHPSFTSRSGSSTGGFNILSPLRPFVPPFVFAVLSPLSLNFLSDYFYVSLNLVASLTVYYLTNFVVVSLGCSSLSTSRF